MFRINQCVKLVSQTLPKEWKTTPTTITFTRGGRFIAKAKRHPKQKPPQRGSLETKVFGEGKFAQLHNKTGTTKVETQINNFDQLKIFPIVRQAMLNEIRSQYNLKGRDAKDITIKPTVVQTAAIRKLTQSRKVNPKLKIDEDAERIQYELKYGNEVEKTRVFTIAAETGSGKTWSYLAPLLSKLKEDDMAMWKADEQKYQDFKKAHQVRSMILVPTNELVEQVYDVLKRVNQFELPEGENLKVSENYQAFSDLEENRRLRLSIKKLNQGDPPVDLFRYVEEYGKIDVLVTTPGKITAFSKLENINRPFRIFTNLRYCVLDEADTLFDDSFEKNTTDVITHLPKLLELILVSATIPKAFEKKISKLFPDTSALIRVTTPSLHRIPRSIKVMTIDADESPYNGSKPRALGQAIYAISNDSTEAGHVKRIIVFVNEKSEVDGIVESLITKYKVRPQDICGVSGLVKINERRYMLEPFLNPAEKIGESSDDSKVKILVTTDLLARGLNFQSVRNVILLGLPRSSVDLVHRLGRTGRMHQQGRVFIILDKRDKKSWIKGLAGAVSKGIKIG
ncbi:MRH4 ATP-dependent RNA helicase MRH4 [Candida maltosa Xu316]